MRHFEDYGDDAGLIVFALEVICLAFGFLIWWGDIILCIIVDPRDGLARGPLGVRYTALWSGRYLPGRTVTRPGRNPWWHLIDCLCECIDLQGTRSRREPHSRTKQSMFVLCCWSVVESNRKTESEATTLSLWVHIQSHGPLRRVREAYSGPVSPQCFGQSMARQVRSVLRV